MNDEAGFLKAIADQPAERATRLAYADWLDEQGRGAEAEFLKLQFQAAELSARLIESGGQLDPGWLAAVGNISTERRRFTLRSGRDVVLTALRQWNFYAGLLEGVPSSQQNREGVQRLVADEQLRRGELPYLIEPTERPVERPQSRGGGPWGLLPAVACVGQFESFGPARDEGRDGSQLTVVWFQDEFAFPIDPGVREHIRGIDWSRHAHDFDW